MKTINELQELMAECLQEIIEISNLRPLTEKIKPIQKRQGPATTVH